MTGMVEALHRICFTSRYRSYRGFMICLSFLVTCSRKRLLASFCLTGYTANAHEHDNRITTARAKALSPKPSKNSACGGETKVTHREDIQFGNRD